MNSKPCLKCGHFAEFDWEAPRTCPMCGASYAHIESALARGETIPCAEPDEIVAREQQREAVAKEPPGKLVSILIAIGFAVTLLALLAGLGIFGVILSAPGKPDADPWTTANALFVRGLVVGWSVAALVSLGYALLRRPLAGVLAGTGLGLMAGVLSAFISY